MNLYYLGLLKGFIPGCLLGLGCGILLAIRTKKEIEKRLHGIKVYVISFRAETMNGTIIDCEATLKSEKRETEVLEDFITDATSENLKIFNHPEPTIICLDDDPIITRKEVD